MRGFLLSEITGRSCAAGQALGPRRVWGLGIVEIFAILAMCVIGPPAVEVERLNGRLTRRTVLQLSRLITMDHPDLSVGVKMRHGRLAIRPVLLQAGTVEKPKLRRPVRVK